MSEINKENKAAEYGDKAAKYFEQGYNCSQSVVLAFHEELGISEETAAKLGSSFGGGLARMREVCGAVSGMALVAGLKCGYTDPGDAEAKKNHYALVQKMADEFKERNGSIVCGVLLGVKRDGFVPEKRTEEYYKKRPCSAMVADAGEIVYRELFA